MTLLAQITDTHIRAPGHLADGSVDTSPYLEQAIATLLRLPQQPDAVVLTGDLTDLGRVEDYQLLRTLLAPLPMPVYLLPGNHDERARLRQAFPEQPAWMGSGFAQFSLPVGAMQLVVLDTVTAGHSAGALCPERLQWLEQTLAAHSGRPVVIAMHHPPFQTMIAHMDEIGLLQGAAELEAMVRRHPQVQRIVCGHLHRHIQTLFGGTLALTAPSTAHQIYLDLAPDGVAGWTLEPPGFMLHALSAQGRMVSHLVASGNYPGPYPFR